MKIEYYFLIIHGDVEPELQGPFETYEQVEHLAKRFVRNNSQRNSGIFWLESIDGKLDICSWSGGETETWLEEQ